LSGTHEPVALSNIDTSRLILPKYYTISETVAVVVGNRH
jgi:hypothetical protein